MFKIIPKVTYALLIILCFKNVANAEQTLENTQTFQKINIDGTNRELGMGLSIFPPNSFKARHEALGPEIVYVLQGDITVKIDGKPKKTVHAGESYKLAAKDIHVTRAGPKGAKTIASWVNIPGKNFNIYTK
ncbi:cupin domain-containing protein [Pantoea stewartii]|uniref:cupin domain-containing protein n=1 Tax=Pantoea stewartii TaxID=66269 RepID=UPI00162AA880|nr:cupin domain-containing protein [Pantoea stewartii]MBC0856512.1 cupin domain-containing protein [Pantoea stewartii]